MKFQIVFVSFLITSSFFGQITYDTVALTDLKRHLSILASDTMEGRETGTPGIEKAAVYLENEFKRIGLAPGNGTSFRQAYKMPHTQNKAYNILAQMEGSTFPNEYVVVSAHYDHLGMEGGEIYNGADDDGSGTASLLAMAETLMKQKMAGKGPKRTVLFIAFSGEEKGLWGSEYFSKFPTIPLNKISCDVNIDMIGRIDPDRKSSDTNRYVYLVGHSRISSQTQIILNAINDKTHDLFLDDYLDRRDDPNQLFYRSDHYNFAKKGVPVVFFYDGMLGGDYHQPTDDIEKIDWPIYHNRVNFILDFIQVLATRSTLLPRDLPLD